MPSQNVEIVRRAHEALNGGDMDTLVVPCDAAFRLDLSDRSFNPAVGLNYNPSDAVTLYGGYNEGMRAPTPIELTWTLVPLALSMIPFVWGARIYFAESQPPGERGVVASEDLGQADGRLVRAHWYALERVSPRPARERTRQTRTGPGAGRVVDRWSWYAHAPT